MQVSREQLTSRTERGPASLLLPLERLCFSVVDEIGEYGDIVPSLFDALSILGTLLFPVLDLAHQAGRTAYADANRYRNLLVLGEIQRGKNSPCAMGLSARKGKVICICKGSNHLRAG